MNRYLNGDPIPWLTDGENPAVTYLAKRELNASLNPEQLYTDLIESRLTSFFLKNSSEGVTGDQKNPDIFYRGTVWFFLLAAESGYDLRTDFVRRTADFIFLKSQQNDGGFSFNWHPPVSVGCRTGNIVHALIRTGINDDRTDSGIRWIKDHQRHDGGWLHCPFRGICDVMKLVVFRKSGKGHLDDENTNIPSCPVATYTCMNALSEVADDKYSPLISRAADYFLSNNFFTGNNIYKTGCGLFTDPLNAGYPVMSQFDIISLLTLISGTGLWNSVRAGEMFNYVIKNQSNTGRWGSANSLQGMIQDEKMESRWVTLNALRLIKSVSSKEGQLEKA